MAIQIPNPGTGNGATGDNEYVLWSKTRDNFSDTTHAANRLVGEATGNVMTVGAFGLGSNTAKPFAQTTETEILNALAETGSQFFRVVMPNPIGYSNSTGIFSLASKIYAGIVVGSTGQGVRAFSGNTDTTGHIYTLWTDRNTTKEAETGYLVASSPVLKVQHDNFEKVHEAEQLDIDVQHLEIGVYAITGTTGLRENDGWNLKPPKDVNGNVLCICEATQDGDVITLKTYKKKFDFETVSIVADYEQPTDIPDSAEVMLRFNDLPIEIQPEV